MFKKSFKINDEHRSNEHTQDTIRPTKHWNLLNFEKNLKMNNKHRGDKLHTNYEVVRACKQNTKTSRFIEHMGDQPKKKCKTPKPPIPWRKLEDGQQT